jgi:hypothetical protein
VCRKDLVEFCRIACGVTPWQWAASGLISIGIALLLPETPWGKGWLGEMPLWVMLLAYACLLSGIIVGIRSGHLGPLLILGYLVALLYIAVLVLAGALLAYPIMSLVRVGNGLVGQLTRHGQGSAGGAPAPPD